MATVFVERVIDGLVLVLLLASAVWVGGFTGETVVGGVTLGGVMLGGGMITVGLLLLAIFAGQLGDPVRRFFQRTGGTDCGRRWHARLAKGVDDIVAGLQPLRDRRRLALVGSWSVVIWITNATSMWLGLVAFEITVPWSAPLLLQGLVALGIAIPSTPGFFGPFEAAMRLGLALYGVAPGSAVPFAIAIHLASFVPISLLGLWALIGAPRILPDRSATRVGSME